jgi:hypothetical protein
MSNNVRSKLFDISCKSTDNLNFYISKIAGLNWSAYIHHGKKPCFLRGVVTLVSPSGHNPLLEEEKKLLFCFSQALPPISTLPAEIGPLSHKCLANRSASESNIRRGVI